MKKKFSFYEILTFVAYGFYMLLGLLWFSVSLFNARFFNPWAFLITVIFGMQYYFNHRLTNLIVGILGLFFSIWMVLEVLSNSDTGVKHTTYDSLAIAEICFFSLSIIMSGILIFSYTKLAFKDM